jgi:hypothetical protein
MDTDLTLKIALTFRSLTTLLSRTSASVCDYSFRVTQAASIFINSPNIHVLKRIPRAISN